MWRLLPLVPMVACARTPSSAAPRGHVPVVEVARALPPGEPLFADDLRVVWVAEEARPLHTFGSADALARRVAREWLLPGEPVRGERLAPPGTAPGVPARLLPGEGAVEVPAFPMARVGDLVDLVLTGSDGGCAVTQRARVVSSSETILTVAAPTSEIHSIEAAADQRVYLRNGLDGVEAAPRHCEVTP